MSGWIPNPTRALHCQFECEVPMPQCCCDRDVVPSGDHWSPCPLKYWVPFEGCRGRPVVRMELASGLVLDACSDHGHDPVWQMPVYLHPHYEPRTITELLKYLYQPTQIGELAASPHPLFRGKPWLG